MKAFILMRTLKKTTARPASTPLPPNGAYTGFYGRFRYFAHWLSIASGSPLAFLIALMSILVWGITGPLFHFSDTWQLIINTATTVITFLMVFVIQNTQNRDTRAIHLKLDELLHGVAGARNSLVHLESLSDDELDRLQKEFERLRGRASRTENTRATRPVRPNAVHPQTTPHRPGEHAAIRPGANGTGSNK
jgi:low affinity Fe/Cu permease